MSFTDAVKSCFQKFFTFSGRAPRAEFWYFSLFTWLLSLATSGLDALFFGADFSEGGLLNGVTSVAVLVPGVAVQWRRLHDIGKPGWYFLIWVLAIIAAFALTVVSAAVGIILLLVAGGVLLYWNVKPSDPGMNAYGPNPYDDPGQDIIEVFQ